MTTKFLTAAWITLAAAASVRAQSLLYEAYGKGFDDQLGRAVAGGVDFDLDGYDDVLVGMPFADVGGLSDSGGVHVVSGRTGAALFKLSGDQADDHFGWSVALAGDVNADGWPDFVVGAPNAWNGSARTGLARVFSGRNGNVLRSLYGANAGDEFGFAVGGELDLDGDGRADVIVGAPGLDYAPLGLTDVGTATVYSGANGANLAGYQGGVNGLRVGEAVCGSGDLDGDGVRELVVGVPRADAPPFLKTATGSVVIRWASNTYQTKYGDATGDRFGASLASGVDVDGDGLDELLVGAPGDDDGGLEAGSVRMFGAAAATVLHTWHGASADDGLGSSVACAGDVDGDGRGDVLAGAPEDRPGGRGHVLVLSSGSLGELLRLEGELASRFGSSVSGAGDFNADGIPDVVSGAHLALDPDQPVNAAPGLARVHSLAAPGFVSYCTAGSSASGCQAQISGSGLPSATAPSGFYLIAAQVEAGKDGIFFFGSSGRKAAAWGNGTSFLCVAPPTKRANVMPGVGLPGTCDGQYWIDLNARWCPSCPKAHHNPGPGALVQAQLWYRDPQSSSNQTTSLSGALEFALLP